MTRIMQKKCENREIRMNSMVHVLFRRETSPNSEREKRLKASNNPGESSSGLSIHFLRIFEFSGEHWKPRRIFHCRNSVRHWIEKTPEMQNSFDLKYFC
jgi:hypothetical protein